MAQVKGKLVFDNLKVSVFTLLRRTELNLKCCLIEFINKKRVVVYDGNRVESCEQQKSIDFYSNF